MSDRLTKTVRKALEEKPASDRALAQEAGIPQSTVSRIRTGVRDATPDVAKALADALGRWADNCRAAETALRRTLEKREEADG